MSKKSAFRHYPLNQAKRYQQEVSKFLGVDYNTHKFLVSEGRAIDLKNYIWRNNSVQKRYGYEQIMHVADFWYIPASFEVPTQEQIAEIHSNVSDKQVNRIWAFEAEDGNLHVVAHIGKLLYEVKNIDTDNVTVDAITTGVATVNGETHALAYEFENYKSFAFVGGKKLWFLGGNKYMCLRFLKNGSISFFAVEDSASIPIPTTTISITYRNSIVNQRMGLDNVNLLTKWRYNQLITGTTKKEDEKTQTVFYEYTLDAPLYTKNQKDWNDVYVTIEERGKTK